MVGIDFSSIPAVWKDCTGYSPRFASEQVEGYVGLPGTAFSTTTWVEFTSPQLREALFHEATHYVDRALYQLAVGKHLVSEVSLGASKPATNGRFKTSRCVSVQLRPFDQGLHAIFADLIPSILTDQRTGSRRSSCFSRAMPSFSAVCAFQPDRAISFFARGAGGRAGWF
jgi:hypothetical protein